MPSETRNARSKLCESLLVFACPRDVEFNLGFILESLDCCQQGLAAFLTLEPRKEENTQRMAGRNFPEVNRFRIDAVGNDFNTRAAPSRAPMKLGDRGRRRNQNLYVA